MSESAEYVLRTAHFKTSLKKDLEMTLKEVKEAPKAENIETQIQKPLLKLSLFVSVAELTWHLLLAVDWQFCSGQNNVY